MQHIEYRVEGWKADLRSERKIFKGDNIFNIFFFKEIHF